MRRSGNTWHAQKESPKPLNRLRPSRGFVLATSRTLLPRRRRAHDGGDAKSSNRIDVSTVIASETLEGSRATTQQARRLRTKLPHGQNRMRLGLHPRFREVFWNGAETAAPESGTLPKRNSIPPNPKTTDTCEHRRHLDVDPTHDKNLRFNSAKKGNILSTTQNVARTVHGSCAVHVSPNRCGNASSLHRKERTMRVNSPVDTNHLTLCSQGDLGTKKTVAPRDIRAPRPRSVWGESWRKFGAQ
mmetsp:Transcript_48548/g.128690  ORF Transcript_48548/g.128690 Transcript_48548/m.128690 type:complete len:244 (+) Transcript_48548:163-894(+)